MCGKLIREGEPIFTRYFEQQLAVLFTKSAPEPTGDMPADLACVLRVSAFSHTVTWWFERGTHDAPEQVAAWYTRGMGL